MFACICSVLDGKLTNFLHVTLLDYYNYYLRRYTVGNGKSFSVLFCARIILVVKFLNSKIICFAKIKEKSANNNTILRL